MSLPSVLIVSNGRGEDGVGAVLARALAGRAAVSAFPLVGLGEAYRDITLLEPRRALPSGGFGLRGNWPAFASDLRAGAIGLWRGQRRTLRMQRGACKVVAAIGDAYCLWMAAHAAPTVVFVGTAKSASNEPYGVLERRLLRRRAAVVFARDRPTAETLSVRGIPARYDGNALMDTIPAPRDSLPIPRGAPAVLLLPGSRSDALSNLLLLLAVARRVNATVGAAFVCAIPSTLLMAEVARGASRLGWEVDAQTLRSAHTSVHVTRDFGSALQATAVAVGLAGTANEQAAGMGVPVVAFSPPHAVQYTPRFLILQQRLLGDALLASRSWESAADSVAHLLKDPAERARRGEVGRTRMGGPGAVPRIAEVVLQRIS